MVDFKFEGKMITADIKIVSKALKFLKKINQQEKEIAIYFSVARAKENASFHMRNETLKLADEIGSSNENDCQRIGYFFGNLFKEIKEHCSGLR